MPLPDDSVIANMGSGSVRRIEATPTDQDGQPPTDTNWVEPQILRYAPAYLEKDCPQTVNGAANIGASFAKSADHANPKRQHRSPHDSECIFTGSDREDKSHPMPILGISSK